MARTRKQRTEPASVIDSTVSALVPQTGLVSPLTMSDVPASAALEIAEGSQSPDVILGAAGFSSEQIDWLMSHEPFLAQIERFRADLQKNGYTFRSKAAVLAEEHLATVHRLVDNDEVSPAVRLDAVKWLARVGNLEPKEGAGPGREGVSITINLGGGAQPITIGGPNEQLVKEVAA